MRLLIKRKNEQTKMIKRHECLPVITRDFVFCPADFKVTQSQFQSQTGLQSELALLEYEQPDKELDSGLGQHLRY